MKVVISTAGRFHLFALARELERRELLERIYSGFPWRALERESVSRARVSTFPWLRTPFMAMGRPPLPAPARFRKWLEKQSLFAQDAYVARRLPECDAFIGHDGVGLRSGQEARRRGYRYMTDTGTAHLRYQRELLGEEYASNGLPRPTGDGTIYSRQLEEYEAADVIVTPSDFVKQSFLSEGVAERKLRVAPYGARIEFFHPVGDPAPDIFRVLFVGNFSVTKGVRYLLQAFRGFAHPGKELLIAGTVADELRPLIRQFSDVNARFLGPVPHLDLPRLYSSSHVLALPSICEGFGMVMAEALACGCPVLASTNTGAANLFAHGREGFIVPIRDAAALRDRLTQLADEPDTRRRMSAAAVDRMRSLKGWHSYGDAYADLLASATEFSAPATPARRPSRWG